MMQGLLKVVGRTNNIISSKFCRGDAWVVFCPNQVTVAIAQALLRDCPVSVHAKVFYWPGRCDVSILRADGVRCVEYGGVRCAFYFLIINWRKRIKVFLPHRKLGPLANMLSLLGASTALIDDGLDTFRDIPHNVKPALFPPNTCFYTFRYPFSLGAWIEKFEVRPVADITSLEDVERRVVNLHGVRRLIIESPPLELVAGDLALERKETMLIKHSNINKQRINVRVADRLNGADIAVEKSLRGYQGEVIVGESMVAVYALLMEKPDFRLTVYIAKTNIVNLRPLIRLIESRDFAELRIVE